MSATLLGALLIPAGILITLIPSAVAKSGPRLNGNAFTLQVFTPSIIGLVLITIGVSLYIYNSITQKGVDELFLLSVISMTAIGGIFVSLMTIMNSYLQIHNTAS